MTRKRREDWLRAGHQLLIEQGADGLQVDRLAAQVGVTKGSFYHHFPHLSGFKTELIGYLERVGYWEVVGQVDRGLGAADQLRQLTRLIARVDLREDKAVRLWAERDEDARSLLRRVDERRLTYLGGLFTEVSGDAARGAFMAQLTYAFFLGAAQIEPRIEGEEYAQMARFMEHLFTLPIPPPPPSEAPPSEVQDA